MSGLAELTVQPFGLRGKIKKGETLLEAVRSIGISLPSVCGGLGSCGKCIVRILEGEVSPPSRQELKLLGGRVREGFRLACQTRLLGDVRVEVPEETLEPTPKLAIEGMETTIRLNPMVKEAIVEVKPPSLTDLRSDQRRLLDALKHQTGVEAVSISRLSLLQKAPSILRLGNWKVRIIYHLKLGILDILPAKEVRRGLYGLAIDIGTAKIAMYLVDLKTGEVKALGSALNPQLKYGEDIVSRISYASNLSRTLELQKTLIDCLNRLLAEVCEDAGADPEEVYEVVAVGNTAMHHILLGITPKTLGLAPFAPVVQKPVNVEACEVGLRVNESANLYVLPVVAGFVGADAVADIVATRLYESDKPSMVVDIGTNTEIILSNGEQLYACSCASGPAFEGARIRHGMRAGEGAIERVWITGDDVEYRVIGCVKPMGMCGSGVVDAVAQLLKVGVLKPDGRFDPSKRFRRLIRGGYGYEFILAKPKETATGKPITITQKDVREIQLAKSAIATGMSILMEEAEVDPDELSTIYLAGSFGTYINPESALRIGLLPKVDLGRIRSVGNAAGVGARMCLISREERVRAETLARQVRFVEFYAKPGFRRLFLENLKFPEV